jgi:D,D-heptose 1,7-bisphosphate phosphatase
MKKAIFLDRDNTLIRDTTGYFHDTGNVAFLPGVPEGLKKLQDAGFSLFVVTNQSGIGRGYFPESDTVAVHQKIIDLLKKEDVIIEKIYYCPHAPEENCACRKPKPFLVLKAAQEYGIDLAKSFFIGDHMKDMEAGRSAGTMTVLVGSPENISSPVIDILARDVADAANKIISYEKLHRAVQA